MDWQIRIALLVFGVALVAFIYYDYAKKQKLKKENEKLKKQFSQISNGVDSSGFDLDGVGVARPKNENQTNENQTNEIENKIEPTIGTINSSSNEPKIDQALTRDSQTGSDSLTEDNTLTEQESKTENNFEPRIYSLIIQASKDKPYSGREFMPLFLSQGLKFGEMNIFHRYKNIGKNPGEPIYSLANAVEPGTFDLAGIDSFSTPALAIFAHCSGQQEFANHYVNMVKTAEFFVNELGGELLDDSRQAYTELLHQERLSEINQLLQ